MPAKFKSPKLFSQVARACQIFGLTHRYYRASQIADAEGAAYFINGHRVTIVGPNHLPLVLELVTEDSYGLSQCGPSIRTIIDLGANIGVFSVHARQLWPQARIVAVEPGRTANHFMARNLAEMKVETVRCAVGPRDGTVSLSIPQDLSAATICETPPDTAAESCEMVTFDRIADRFEYHIDLLKLDCEGAEYHILQSPALDKVRRIRGELHTCSEGNPNTGLKQLAHRGFVVTKWQPFPNGVAGIVWADRRAGDRMQK